MLSILPLESPMESPAEAMRTRSEPAAEQNVEHREERAAAEETAPGSENLEEFEIVLGRKQVASVLFVAIVAMVVFASIAYLAGRALAPKPVAAVPAPVSSPAPVIEATIIKAPEFPLPDPAPKEPAPAATTTSAEPEPSIFANPSPNAVYLQMGAVEKGVAVIMVDGLRKRGFPAFAAPGPTDVIFRVLIGPLSDAEAFRKTKEKIDQIGLNSFARKYQP